MWQLPERDFYVIEKGTKERSNSLEVKFDNSEMLPKLTGIFK